jgi:anti-sigma regulatory factor (Ser/Thr protein kinase)
VRGAAARRLPDKSGEGEWMKKLRIRFRHGEPAASLRHEVRSLLDPVCSPDTVEDALLVTSELVQNVTQHTGSDGELAMTVTSNEVLIEVFDGDRRMPVRQKPDARRIGGRGLLLVSATAQQWGTRMQPAGKVVWARIAVPAGADTRAAA